MQHGNKTRGTGPLGGAGMVGLWGASSLIDSLQRGEILLNTGISNTQTATITSVDTSRSRLRLVGYRIDTGTVNNQGTVRLTFTNATTITAFIVGGGGGGVKLYISYEVTEYRPGVIKSIQRGTCAGNTTATITSINTGKTELDALGASGSDANTNITSVCQQSLTNATTVTVTGVGGANDTGSFQVVEFF